MENDKSIWSMHVKQNVLTAFKPRKTVESQNAWNLYGDIAWFGVLAGVVTSFVSVFIIRLGGSDTQVGLLSALPAFVTIFVSMPGSVFVERETRPLSVLLVTGVLYRAGYLVMGLLPLFLATGSAWGVVILSTLLTIPQSVANIAFTTMFAAVVKPERRAHIVSVRNALIGITSTATALIGGKFLDWFVFPLNYTVLFTLAFAASLMSSYYLTRIQLPPTPAPPVPRMPAQNPGLGGFFSIFRSSSNFARFTLTSFAFQWGLFFTVPLYSIYVVRSLHASEGWIGLINMVASGTTILFYPLWGRLTARRGNRIAMIITTAGLAGYALLTPLIPSLYWILFVAFWGGIFSSGQVLAFFNGLLEVCGTPIQRPARIAAYNTLVNVAAFAAPLISTVFVDRIGIENMLIAGGLLRLFGTFLIWQQRALDKKPRATG